MSNTFKSSKLEVMGYILKDTEKMSEDLVKIQIKLKKIEKEFDLKIESPTTHADDYVREILNPLLEEKNRLRKKRNQLKESHRELNDAYTTISKYRND
jgi:ATP-dependent protease HslVU (ClpYQ) ATPase subunit